VLAELGDFPHDLHHKCTEWIKKNYSHFCLMN